MLWRRWKGGRVDVDKKGKNGNMPAQQTDRTVGCMREGGSDGELTEQKRRERSWSGLGEER